VIRGRNRDAIYMLVLSCVLGTLLAVLVSQCSGMLSGEG
jgi:hypothetical protein